jgi:hypothetical protein
VTLVDWALSDAWQRDFPSSRFRLGQPSRNAATVLSSPNRKLWAELSKREPNVGEAVFDRVFNFVAGEEPEMVKEAEKKYGISYAGHFQRIVESFFRQDEDWIPESRQSEFYFHLFRNLLDYVDTLAYQQLLFIFVLDLPFILVKHYRKPTPEDAIEAHILTILKKAFEYTIVIEAYSRPMDGNQKLCQRIRPVRAPPIASQERMMKSQACAFTIREVPMLSPPMTDGRIERNPYGSNNPGYRKRLEDRIERFGLQNQLRTSGRSTVSPEELFDRATSCAYFLLSTIDTMLTEKPELLVILQRLPATSQGSEKALEPSILEYLLAIGVYSDKDSPVAPLAFRLARLIAHGYKGLQYKFRTGAFEDSEEPLPESTPRFGDPVYNQLVAAYAQDFQFGYPLTSQMIAGFEIFWNQRYMELQPSVVAGDPEFDPVRYPVIELDILGRDHQTVMRTWKWKRPRGNTPLEIYTHFLFYDPAPSDFFSQAILRVIDLYHDYTKQFRNPDEKEFDSDEDYAEYQEQLLRYDIVFYDVLRTVFRANDGKIIDMTAIGDLLPYPHNLLYQWGREQKIRAPLNGAPIEFGLLWLRCDFFTEQAGTTPMIDLPAARIPDGISDIRKPRYKRLYAGDFDIGEDAPTPIERSIQPHDKPTDRDGLRDLTEEESLSPGSLASMSVARSRRSSTVGRWK